MTIATEKVLTISAISNGTVIDHIPAGQALRIATLLNLSKHPKTVTLALNLPSASMGAKDIVKVEERELSNDEANQVAIFAPKATINIIKDFSVIKKFKVTIPNVINGLLRCTNPSCISNHERTTTSFKILHDRKVIHLQCRFCQKLFPHTEIS